jgi:vesicle-associated membrane protein 7
MPILYALVARGRNVLAEHTTMSGNFTTVTNVLLSKISQTEVSKMSYVYDKHVFHYTINGGIVFMCMCEDEASTKRRTAFAFLDAVMSSWRNSYSGVELSAAAFAMQEVFQPEIARLMKSFNSSNQGNDNIDRVKMQIESVKETMVENIDALLERGEKIELLVDRTEQLNQTSYKFERSTRSLKNEMLYRKIKMYALYLVILFFICLFLAMAICGADLKHCPNSD